METHPDVSFKTYGIFRSPQELSEELHKAAGDKYTQQILSGERGLVTTCGSGMTAAILWLGINRIWEAENKAPGDVGLYDEVSGSQAFILKKFSYVFFVVMDGVCGQERKQD